MEFPQIVTKILEEYNEDVKSSELYHYTDGRALQSIIENNQLWLSDRDYMNDINDHEYIRNIVKDKFKNSVNFQGSLFEQLLISRLPQYVFSTSLEKDLIHQWSYYSDTDSYCLEFDRHELRDYLYKFKHSTDYFYYGPVIYKPDVAKKIVNIVMETYEEHILAVISTPVPQPEKEKLLKRTQEVYQFFYSLIKQYGHYCEKEFRFLYRSKRKPKFKIKKGLFVPYIEIGNKTDKIPIKKIIIGPNNHELIAKDSLEIFLKQNGYESVIIEKSELNIRSET